MSVLDEPFGTTWANSYYIQHPSAGLSQDGEPVGAGTAAILQNNIAVLKRESVRHLAFIQGPGNPGKGGNQYGGLADVSQPFGILPDEQLIPWDRSTCARLGTYFAFPDQDTASQANVLIRPVRVSVYCKSGSTDSLKIAAALHPPRVTPWDRQNWDFVTWVSAPTSDGYVTLDLVYRNIITSETPTSMLRARAASGHGAYSNVIEYCVTVGWLNTHATGDRVYNISVWESREIAV